MTGIPEGRAARAWRLVGKARLAYAVMYYNGCRWCYFYTVMALECRTQVLTVFNKGKVPGAGRARGASKRTRSPGTGTNRQRDLHAAGAGQRQTTRGGQLEAEGLHQARSRREISRSIAV